jgi:hypothetical protein
MPLKVKSREKVKRTAEGAYTFHYYFMLISLGHIISLINCPMQIYVEFLMIWREREEREQRGCFAKQMSHVLKLRTMRLLTHHYTSSCCHATHNIPFFYSVNSRI